MLETHLYRDLSEQTKRDLAQYGSRSVPEGADTAVWLASSAEVDGVTGRFFEQGAEKPCEFRDQVAESASGRRANSWSGTSPGGSEPERYVRGPCDWPAE